MRTKIGKILRLSEWWNSKGPPLIGIWLLQIMKSGMPETEILINFSVLLISFFCLGGFGYFINDTFDIEIDKLADKSNQAESQTPIQRVLLLITLFIVGISPIYIYFGSSLPLWLMTTNFLLFIIYSVPPVRFKERGLLGVICDASAAHVIPTLFVIFATNILAEPNKTIILAVFVVWSLAYGIKGIIFHMLQDRYNDIRTKVKTWATQIHPNFISRVAFSLILLIELPFFIILIGLHYQIAPFWSYAFLFYCSIELIKHYLGWNYKFSRNWPAVLPNMPLVNNYFYELWFPLSISINLAFNDWRYSLFIMVVLIFFWKNVLEQFRHLKILGVATINKIRIK